MSYALPTFSGGFNQINTQVHLARMNRPMIPLINQRNQNFQVKFNYKSTPFSQQTVFMNQPQPLTPIPLANLANIQQ